MSNNTFKGIANSLIKARKQIEEEFGYTPKFGTISQAIISEFGPENSKQGLNFDKVQQAYRNNVSAAQIAQQEYQQAKTQQAQELHKNFVKLQKIISANPLDMNSFIALAGANGFNNIVIVAPHYKQYKIGLPGGLLQVEVNTENNEVISVPSYGI